MKRYELIAAGILLTLSAILKICSLVMLCTAHAHTEEELPHDATHKVASKKQRATTHLPVK